MKLQLEMMETNNGIQELKSDITEMELMIDGYLAFARGEGEEIAEPMKFQLLSDLLLRIGSATV